VGPLEVVRVGTHGDGPSRDGRGHGRIHGSPGRGIARRDGPR